MINVSDPKNYEYRVVLKHASNHFMSTKPVFPTLVEAAAFVSTQPISLAAIEIVRVWKGERTPLSITFTEVSESMKHALKTAIQFLESGLNADGLEHQMFRGEFEGCDGLNFVSVYYQGVEGCPVIAFETEWMPEHEQDYGHFNEQRRFTQDTVDLLQSALVDAGANVYKSLNGAGSYTVSYGIRNKAVFGARDGGTISRMKGTE